MKLREVLLICFIVFLFVVGVFGWIMLRETIVSTGLYLGIIAIPAVIAGVIIGMRMGRVTGFTNTLINILFTAVSIWILIGSGLIALNFFTARSSEGEMERAIIEKKFTQTRYRTERNGRHGVSRGAPYKVYNLRLYHPAVKNRTFEVSKPVYDAVSKEDTVLINISRGCLKMRVMDIHHLKPLHPRKKKSTRRCKFFGTSGRK